MLSLYDNVKLPDIVDTPEKKLFMKAALKKLKVVSSAHGKCCIQL